MVLGTESEGPRASCVEPRPQDQARPRHLARRAEHYALGAQCLARRASSCVRRVKGFTPRTKGRALRGKCEERRAKCYAPSASRYGLRAQGQGPSAQREVRGPETDGSHLADLGFETRCVTRIESRGQGFAVPLGVRAARSTRDGFSSPRGGRGGYPFFKKKNNISGRG